jgi:cytidylate kinase
LLVTISGLPGSGTSTVAVGVAAALGIPRLDGGTVFRAMAAERGMSLAEFGAVAESDASVDLELDARLAEVARNGDVVLESRLAGWIAANEGVAATKVWIGCDPGERAARVAAREGTSQDAARTANDLRELSEAKRYAEYYGIELADLSVYDLVLDSTTTPPDELIAAILERGAA